MPRSTSGSESDRIATYLDVILLIERLHRQFLEVVSVELESVGIYGINNVQALMLFNIDDAEMTIGELTTRGAYLGSNVSYNVKKMFENGYLLQERSLHDRRSIHVRLTTKGRRMVDRFSAMHRQHVALLGQSGLLDSDLQGVSTAPRRLEQFLEPPVSMRCILDDLLHKSFGHLAPTEINHCQYEPICPHLNQGLISVSDSGWLILCPTAVAAHRRVRMLIEPKRATIAKREAI
jgi:DNA-binding MarR family transcriptional regulator